MNKKLLITLSIMVISATAMESRELTINQQAMPTDAIEEKVVIIIEDQEKEVPARYIPFIKTLENLRADLPEPSSIPLPQVSLAAWQLIEPQLERVSKNSQGYNTKDEIHADYNQLDSTNLIDLSRAVEYLDIPLLKELTLELAQNKLTSDEIITLSADMRNEVIKRKAFKIVGLVPPKELAVYRGHGKAVTSVCVTSDNRIVSGSIDGTVRIWDMSGNQLVVCKGHEKAVWSVCVTSDNRIVSGSEDETVRIWDRSGKELAVYWGHEGIVSSVSVTSDNRIVSGSYDGTVRIWDMSGNELAVCRGHEIGVTSVCVTSDNRIVSGSEDETVRIWDMSGNELAVCRGHEGGGVNSVCVTSDNRIVSGSFDNTVRIWDMSGNELAVCRGHEIGVMSVCVTSDNRIVSGSYDGTVRIWDMSGNELAVCLAHKDNVWSVCATSDNRVVSGSADETVRIWDSRSDITLNNRLANMNEKQAKLIDRVLERTKSLLDELKVVMRKNEARLLGWIDLYGQAGEQAFVIKENLKRGILERTPGMCMVHSKHCWQEIEGILDEEVEEIIVEQPKKRKEVENGESNPAKKVRLSQELTIANKE